MTVYSYAAICDHCEILTRCKIFRGFLYCDDCVKKIKKAEK